MKDFYQFASENPFLVFFLLLIVITGVASIIDAIFFGDNP